MQSCELCLLVLHTERYAGNLNNRDAIDSQRNYRRVRKTTLTPVTSAYKITPFNTLSGRSVCRADTRIKPRLLIFYMYNIQMDYESVNDDTQAGFPDNL